MKTLPADSESATLIRMLEIQSRFSSFPKSVELADCVVDTFKSLPGVRQCGIYLAKDARYIGDQCEQCDTIFHTGQHHSPTDAFPIVIKRFDGNTFLYPLKTPETIYGYYHLNVHPDAHYQHIQTGFRPFVRSLIAELHRRHAPPTHPLQYGHEPPLNRPDFTRHALQQIFNAIPHLIITTVDGEIDNMNQAMLDFLGSDTLDTFKHDHACISDRFIAGADCIEPFTDGVPWHAYVFSHPQLIHHVRMRSNGKIHTFILTVRQIEFETRLRRIAIFTDITERLEIEAALRRHENQLVQIICSNPVPMFVIDADRNITHWNLACENLTGKSAEIMIGTRDHSLAFYPKRRPTIADLMIEAAPQEKINALYKGRCLPSRIIPGVYEGEGFFPMLGSGGCWLSFAAVTLKDTQGETIGAIETLQDITKRKHAESKLRKSQRHLLESQKIAHLGHFTYQVRQACWSSAKTLDEIFGIGKNFPRSFEPWLQQIVHPDYRNAVRHTLTRAVLQKKERIDLEFMIIRHDNQDTRWVHLLATPRLNANDDIIEFFGTVQDITDMHQIEKRLGEQEEIMLLQSRHAAMGEMISLIAHQWRQPISIIAMGANNLLVDIDLDEVDSDRCRQQANDIITQTNYLSQTINDFRNFFQPNRRAESVTVEEIMEECLNIIGKSLEYHNIALERDYRCDLKVHTYSRELLQIFINLIKNAKEALIEKRADNRRIEIIIETDEEMVFTRICDNAGGIEEAILPKIFNPYFTTKEESSGTGLGLYMSRTIAEKHLQGNIEAANIPEGACFTLSLPVKKT